MRLYPRQAPAATTDTTAPRWRSIVAVILGYVVVAAWTFVTFSVAWSALGSEFAFRPGTVETSTRWSLMALGLGFTGALLGGWVTAAFARHPRNTPAKILAVLFLLFGLAAALYEVAAVVPDPAGDIDIASLTVTEAANVARQPAWFAFAIPVVACGGVLLGARLWVPAPSAAGESGRG